MLKLFAHIFIIFPQWGRGGGANSSHIPPIKINNLHITEHQTSKFAITNQTVTFKSIKFTIRTQKDQVSSKEKNTRFLIQNFYLTNLLYIKHGLYTVAHKSLYIDRVWLKNHLIKIIIIPFIFFTLLTYVTHINPG